MQTVFRTDFRCSHTRIDVEVDGEENDRYHINIAGDSSSHDAEGEVSLTLRKDQCEALIAELQSAMQNN